MTNLQRKIAIGLIFGIAILSSFITYKVYGQTIPTIDQWTPTTTPSAAVTQRVYGKALKITGLTTGQCLSLDANSLLTTTTCGSSSGGTDGNWVFFNGSGIKLATTTNQVLIGASATTTLNALEVIGSGYLSSKLGISTTTPGTPLSVTGAGVFTGEVTATKFTGTSTSATSTLAGGLALETSGLVYDWNTNKVGIGTAAPTQALTIVGGNILTDNGQFFQGKRNTGSVAFNLLGIDAGTDIVSMTVPGSGAAANYQIRNSGATNIITLYGDGSLGLGNVSPAEKLNVQGTIAGKIINATNTTATSTFSGGLEADLGVKFPNIVSCDTLDTDINGNVKCGTDATGAGGPFPFTTGTYGAQTVNSTSTGLWFTGSPLSLAASTTFSTVAGIGSTSPFTTLDVFASSSNYAIPGAVIRRIKTDGTETSPVYTLMLTNDAGGLVYCGVNGYSCETHLVLRAGTTTSAGVYTDYRRYLNIQHADGSDAWIWGANASNEQITFDSISGAHRQILDPTALGGNSYYNSVSTGAVLVNRGPTDTVGTGGFQVWSGGASNALRLTVLGTGNVGIGTSSPFSALSVSTTTASDPTTSLFSVASSTHATIFNVLGAGTVGVATTTPFATFSVNPTAGLASRQFVVGSSSATSLVVNNSGNVGIGTANPNVGGYTGSTLTISGSNPSNIEVIRTISSGSSQVGNTTFGDTSNSTLARFGAVTGTSGSTGALFFSTSNGSSLVEGIRLDQNQNLGIGTTSPLAKLSVGSHDGTVPLFVIASSSSALATVTPFIVLGNGNIGIGTSSPYAPLSVNGQTVAAYFTATTSTNNTLPNLVSTFSTSTNATSTNLFATTASTTNLFGSNLATCDPTTGKITWASGQFGCGTDQNSGSATLWNAIGDPSGNGAVAMAETIQTLDWDTAAVSALGEDYLALTVTNDSAADVATQRLLVLENKVGSVNAVEVMQRILNSSSVAVGKGLLIDGTVFTTAIDVADPDIVTALSAGANDLSGTSWSILGADGRFNGVASTTLLSNFGTAYFGGTATSTFSSAGVLTLATPLAVTSGGIGQSTLNDLITLGTHTTGAYISTLSSSGSITVGNSGAETALATVNLNMGNANTWTALQQFAQASTSIGSCYGPCYFGATATSSFSTAGALTLVTPLLVASGGTGNASYGQGWLHSAGGTAAFTSSTSPTVNYILATSTTATSTFPRLEVTDRIKIPAGSSITNQLSTAGEIGISNASVASSSIRFNDGTAVRKIPVVRTFRVGSPATTTWSGTTTVLAGPSPAAITVISAACETDAGTVGVSLYDGTNRANYIVTASTTINTNVYSTNNTFTLNKSMRVDFGTPASSPKKATCTFKYTYDND
jgi:hypothetical protein